MGCTYFLLNLFLSTIVPFVLMDFYTFFINFVPVIGLRKSGDLKIIFIEISNVSTKF